MTLPRYAELPVTAGAPPGSSWGVWGADAVHGSLNLQTPERIVEAARLVRRGAVFPLGWQLELPDPPLFGRRGFSHDVAWLPGELGHDDSLSGWNTQSSSQWDGFRHLRHPEHGFYAGLADEEHGVHHWARRGIVGRAVLVDVAAWAASVGAQMAPDEAVAIPATHVVEAARAQGVEIRPGDVLLLRTGWMAWYRTLDASGRRGVARELRTPGLSPDESTAELLWDLHVSAVAADNPALEAYPPAVTDAPLHETFVHLRILPLLGIPIGELFDLDALAADCAADGVWEGLFTSAPLNLERGVASPPNALVIK